MRDVILHEKVEIMNTGEKATIVWMDEDNIETDFYLLEVEGKEETFVDYYQRDEFKKIND